MLLWGKSQHFPLRGCNHDQMLNHANTFTLKGGSMHPQPRPGMNHLAHRKECEFCFRILAVLILGISLAGCGNTSPSAESGNNKPAARSEGKPVDEATAGSVIGTIRFDGVIPQMKAINMIDVPNCAKMHSAPVLPETVAPGDNGTLQNVIVYLQGDFSAYSFPQNNTAAKVKQEGCLYSPHVTAVMVGDPLEVVNADSVTHNINAISRFHQGWNETQLPGSAPIVRHFTREEIPMIVKCTMHPWMRFYVAVLDHPYFQVTGKDGQFALRNVPPGSYQLTTWHEAFGTKTQTIIIQPKQEQVVSITYTGKEHP